MRPAVQQTRSWIHGKHESLLQKTLNCRTPFLEHLLAVGKYHHVVHVPQVEACPQLLFNEVIERIEVNVGEKTGW